LTDEPASPSSSPSSSPPQAAERGRGALFVALGIFSSRVAGLVRQRVFSHYFGLTSEAGAFTAALRIPNFLNNVLGEGGLSASFIPVYASLLSRGEQKEADRVAGAVAAMLALIVSVLVLIGVVATPLFLDLIAPGFHGDTRALTIELVRILFPAAGLTVLSAWCLGVLNSHRRFLVSYAAPVVWNAAMIATLVIFGRGTDLPRLATFVAWGSVIGSALMVIVQLPFVLRLAPGVRLSLDTTSAHVRTVARNFGPVFVSRGVVQLSGWIDTMLATLISAGATAALGNAQTLYLLPVSLFGMSVSAAELPALSGLAHESDAALDGLRRRLESGLRQIAFFIIPSAVAFLALGDVIAAALFQTGRFSHDNAVFVWGILAGSAVGLLAQTLGRLYSSTYYALRDTRTPLRYAIVRVTLTTVLGYLFALPLPRLLGIDPSWGAAGLTASAGIAGWAEMLLLRSALNQRIGKTGLPLDYVARLWGAALLGAAVAWAIKSSLPAFHPIVVALAVLGPYGIVFFGVAAILRVPEVTSVVASAVSGFSRTPRRSG
jgi:putative peptidoglycan lipid II flippase